MRNRGFALLQVLIVFALLTVIAVSMLYDQRVQIERASQNLFISQSNAFLDSTEALARVVLTLDQQMTEVDHLNEEWNLIQGEFPLAMILQIDVEGSISAEINDLQGRFNINWLAVENESRERALAAFNRLLTLIELETEIADELFNWFDENSGAEYEYLQNTPSYMPSFTALADTSELMLLNTVNNETYATLFPYISALPWQSELNINTAPIEVIQSIAEFIDEPTAQRLLDERSEAGLADTQAFLEYPIFKQNEDTPRLIESLSVTSHWFTLYTEIRLGNRTLKQASLLQRDEQGVIIVGRNRTADAPNQVPGDSAKSGAADPETNENSELDN